MNKKAGRPINENAVTHTGKLLTVWLTQKQYQKLLMLKEKTVHKLFVAEVIHKLIDEAEL